MTHTYEEQDGFRLHLLYPEARIAEAVEQLGRGISADYAGQELTLIVVLQGAFMFAADLARKITVPLRFEFIRLSSYEGMESSGNVVVREDVLASVAGKHLLVVEDIVDTGLTLSHLRENLLAHRPASVRTCALVDKPERRVVPVSVDYAGIVCPGGFLVGYGLDYNGAWRELPAIYHAERITGRRAE